MEGEEVCLPLLPYAAPLGRDSTITLLRPCCAVLAATGEAHAGTLRGGRSDLHAAWGAWGAVAVDTPRHV